MRITFIMILLLSSVWLYSFNYFTYYAQTNVLADTIGTDSSKCTNSTSDTTAQSISIEDIDREMILADSLLTQWGVEMGNFLKKRNLNYYSKLFSSWEKPAIFHFMDEKILSDTTGKIVVNILDPDHGDYFADLMLNLSPNSKLEVYIDRFPVVKEKIVRTKDTLYLLKKNRKKEVLFQRKSAFNGIKNHFGKFFYIGHYKNTQYLYETFENVYEFYLVTLNLEFPREYLVWFDENWNIIRFEEMRTPVFHVGYIVLKD